MDHTISGVSRAEDRHISCVPENCATATMFPVEVSNAAHHSQATSPADGGRRFESNIALLAQSTPDHLAEMHVVCTHGSGAFVRGASSGLTEAKTSAASVTYNTNGRGMERSKAVSESEHSSPLGCYKDNTTDRVLEVPKMEDPDMAPAVRK